MMQCFWSWALDYDLSLMPNTYQKTKCFIPWHFYSKKKWNIFYDKMKHRLWDIREKSWKKMSSQALFQQIRFSAFWPFSQDCNRLVSLLLCFISLAMEILFAAEYFISISLLDVHFFPFIDFVDDIALENCQAENIALVRRTGVVILLGEGESRPKEYAGLSWSSSLKLEQKLTRSGVVMGKLSPEKIIF